MIRYAVSGSSPVRCILYKVRRYAIITHLRTKYALFLGAESHDFVVESQECDTAHDTKHDTEKDSEPIAPSLSFYLPLHLYR